MSLNTSLVTILHTLESHVLSLKEEGVRTTDCRSAARFRENPAPAKSPPAPTPAAPPPPVPPPASVEASAPQCFVHLKAHRAAACGDAQAPEDTALSLFCEGRELQADSKELLCAMLAAIGYELVGDGQPVRTSAELKQVCKHILCFGDAAQQQLSPMRMALSLVRGKWQSTPHGKMMALEAPSYLQNNPTGKKAAWGDLKRVVQDLGLTLPPRP